jgi:mannose-6-phosphate isomerase-like protein (cupin superfamily)
MTNESAAGTASGKTDAERTGSGESRFDEQELRSLEPYEVLDNPVLGQQHRFIRRGTDEQGDYLHSEFRLRADAKSFGHHIHPEQEETCRVLSGEFEVIVDGEHRVLVAGEETTLPAGVPHYHGNVSGIETRILHEISPVMDFEAGLRMFCELAEAGKTNANGQNLLATAVFLREHPNQLYMATPSVMAQHLLFGVLAPVGRLLGYKTDYPPPAGGNRSQ